MLAGLLKRFAGGGLGPRPTFGGVHVVWAILLIGGREHMGRGQLAQALGLGEGAARTLIRRLSSMGLIAVGRRGATLTRKGRRLWEDLNKAISLPVRIDAGRLALDRHNAAILVRGAERGVRLGIEQRDAAVREGATGASTLIYKNGRFMVPGEAQDCEASYPDRVWSTLRRVLSPGEGDVIIVVSAPASLTAEMGCMASALTTLSMMASLMPSVRA